MRSNLADMPKSQPNRKNFGIFCINSFPLQCKIVYISKNFIIRNFYNFDEKQPFLLFNDYKPHC